MIGKRIPLMAAAAALPLSVLAAGPAAATEQHSSYEPSVHIKDVRYHGHDYFSVKLKYKCYSYDADHPEYGSLRVSVTQKHDSYYGWNNQAICDGYWHSKWVVAENHDDVEFKNGKLRVDAKVTDPDGDHDRVYKIYKIKFHGHH